MLPVIFGIFSHISHFFQARQKQVIRQNDGVLHRVFSRIEIPISNFIRITDHHTLKIFKTYNCR